MNQNDSADFECNGVFKLKAKTHFHAAEMRATVLLTIIFTD